MVQTLGRLALEMAKRQILGFGFGVGAGQSSYRWASENLGFDHESHDLNAYIPNPESPGFQNPSWDYAAPTHVCDTWDFS